MFTRAYDAIMCGMYVVGRYDNAFDRTQLSDTILNAKDYNGNIRSLNLAGAQNYYGSASVANFQPPFSYFSNSTTNPGGTSMLPDENSTEPDYEDYQTQSASDHEGWTYVVSSESSEVFDDTTNEYVCTVKSILTNSSGSEKTVYGIAIRENVGLSTSLSQKSNATTYLIARERFAQPVTVPNGGTIKLSLTYRVGRHGVRIDNANGGV